MAVRIVRLGEARQPDEGLRIGTVRRPPRGVTQGGLRPADYYDVWLPELAPSEPLRAWALSKPFTPPRFAEYAKKYRREMGEPAAQRLIALLAALSASTNFSVGCYCEDESHCHRSLLAALLREAGARWSP
jgi:Uncharacterized conserved protein